MEHHALERYNHYLRSLLLVIAAVFVSPAAAQASSCEPTPPAVDRFGINVARDGGKSIHDYAVERLPVGWYLDYTWQIDPPRPSGMRFVQMIRRWRDEPAWQAQLTKAIAANPGSLWILGNEPDNRKQDNLTPDAYAVFYQRAYTFLKAQDPTSQIAIAAVTQPTPLRLRYLDMVLSAYLERFGEPLPVDVWTVHVYTLPENYVWGVGIPPGLDAFAGDGMQYGLDDHDDLTLFAEHLLRFRRWMAARGYGDDPLLVTEFGILLPPRYGFDANRVNTFMQESITWLETATDQTLGYRADGNRLVQGWAWFSLNYYAYDFATGVGHNGHLFDHGSGAMTEMGRAFVAHLQALAGQNRPLIVEAQSATVQVQRGSTTPIRFRLTVSNPGPKPVTGFTVTLGWGAERTAIVLPQRVAADCAAGVPLTVTWSPPDVAAGRYMLHFAATADDTDGTPTATTVVVDVVE